MKVIDNTNNYRNKDEVENWIWFCGLFVDQMAKLHDDVELLRVFNMNRDEKFEYLFKECIKCDELKEYYSKVCEQNKSDYDYSRTQIVKWKKGCKGNNFTNGREWVQRDPIDSEISNSDDTCKVLYPKRKAK
jgi:hypothetical protein